MEDTARMLVGRQVEIKIETRGEPFRKRGTIVGVRDGFLRFKGPSGMETSLPLHDKWFRVAGIEEKAPAGEKA